MMKFFCGTSNIELVEKNKKAFPIDFQSKTRLAYYSSLFNSVEINSTFYRLPRPTTLDKWVMEVPDHFKFTLKLWREITHVKDFAFDPKLVREFMTVANHIDHKKAALLVQLPASTQKIHINHLEKLLDEINKLNPFDSWKIAVEFRHHSWYDSQVYTLLNRYQSSAVWHDMPGKCEDEIFDCADFIYMRFHGPAGDYKGNYSDRFLEEKAKQIQFWLSQGKYVFAYFNNTAQGDAPKDLKKLKIMVKSN